ncbi:glycosyltransferase family 4 protein [Bradyrhizobium guangxiense]|uniref:glycosyltransferase family 4 protein n=1 Tax=Bradyrhizobium guangxiense TaxID=1325115 RepID=UPI0010087BCC|nr:glycosyltransferase family 4 protein [Bradyrhizobium guangxiense]
MSKIFFINRFFFPDHSATSQILSDLTWHLTGRGRSVHVITSGQAYDNPGARLRSEEVIRGVHVHRVSSTGFGRAGLFGRLLDYLSFYWSALAMLWRLVEAGDVVVVKTDPPLLSVPAALVARGKRASLVNWLQDVYPEVATELGVPFLRGPISWLIAKLRDLSLRSAAANVVVGERMRALLVSKNVQPERVFCIPNWCDDSAITEVADSDNPLKSEWKLQDKFVVGYSGNLGRAHDYETMLAAAELLRDHPEVVFLMIGGGHQVKDLAREVELRGLASAFCFKSYQPREQLKQSLCLPDVHWLSLEPRLEGLIVPSKFYGIAAAARPTIAVGDLKGEIAGLVQRYACGIAVAKGDGRGMADAILSLHENAEQRRLMGQNARKMIDEHAGRGRSLQAWESLLVRLSLP